MAPHSSSWTSTSQPRGRRRERRQRFSVFLAALASQRTGASRRAGPGDSLVAAVCALAPIRAARLTTRSVAFAPEPGSRAPGVLRFPVPTPARPGLQLEVDLDPSCGLDSWDRQSLRDGARVLWLMLESTREATAETDGRHVDGAAPLVGSSACMQRLRGQIERVAATDFTVLIEGVIAP